MSASAEPTGPSRASGARPRRDRCDPYHWLVRAHAFATPSREDGVARVDVVKRLLRGASLRTARRMDWVARRERYPKPTLSAATGFDHLLHSRRIPMRRDGAGATEVFELGKRVNVALASPALDGLLLAPGRTFSFW